MCFYSLSGATCYDRPQCKRASLQSKRSQSLMSGRAEDLLLMPESPTRKDVFHSACLPACPPAHSLSLHLLQRSSNRNSTFGSGTFHILGFSSTINGKLAYNTVTYWEADVHKTNTGAHPRAAEQEEGSLCSAFSPSEKLSHPSNSSIDFYGDYVSTCCSYSTRHYTHSPWTVVYYDCAISRES